jgi:hypothetical protein
VQAKKVNINATDDVFLAFTMVQPIMTELSGAMTEKEKDAAITKALFRLLKNNANSVHRALKNIPSNGSQAYVRKQLQGL